MWFAVVLWATTAVGAAQTRPLLDVPYVAQTPELCGGAAVSMVMRYWGARDVAPQDFASLVVPTERGIPTTDLTAAVRSRQWRALVGPPEPAAAWQVIEQDLHRGRPTIALIEVAAQTYHYVVVVGLTAGEIVIHDPARSPFQVLKRADFQRAWSATKFWSVIVLPPDGMAPAERVPNSPEGVSTGSGAANTPCSEMVARGVELALAGNATEADAVLHAATFICSADPSAWRELAGLRFTQKNWREAAHLAGTALRLAPDDTHARELAATSRYLDGDLNGALEWWAPMGEPRIDTLRVTGAVRTPHPTVIDTSGLQTRTVLTAPMFTRAERRVGALPVAARARLSFIPMDGLADVDIAIVEHDAVPTGLVPLGVLAGRALISDELRAEVNGVLRQAERLSLAWRWKSARPRVLASLAFPAPAVLPGIVSFEALWEKQTYASAGRESRRRMSLGLSDWATGDVRWTIGAAADRFDGRRYVSAFAGGDVRLAGDHIAVVATAEVWRATTGTPTFRSGSLSAHWRSTTATSKTVVYASASTHAVTSKAPRAAWPSAGTGGRGALLRAHPLLTNDIVTGPAFARELTMANVEVWQPVKAHLGHRLFVAGFVDAARTSQMHVDAGLGLRLSTLGGTARVDAAHGWRGGGVTWSAGWMVEWPRVY